MPAPSHMTEMFSRAHIAEARLAEIQKDLKKIVVKRYGEIVIVPSAKPAATRLFNLMEEMKNGN